MVSHQFDNSTLIGQPIKSFYSLLYSISVGGATQGAVFDLLISRAFCSKIFAIFYFSMFCFVPYNIFLINFN